ncbi:MAG: tRNA uridine-5-carboxymethylaminomethyl(34) synthesis GTPase MnmE [Hyphomicrobium sp.]|nr:MAG: tRNA uridine-5-carboxymethylaminomethyl(34) synthesis GTPase MnmE [Hyphomicrobium sp.]
MRHPVTKQPIDRAVVFWFAAPLSETGEDVAEFQVHGGPAIVRAMLDALGSFPTTRLAEPGEFIRRAFEHGKVDLAEVEGLADLVEAETEGQRRQALAQAGGALSRLTESWRSQLIDIAALTEAGIDFSDEGDVSSTALAAARTRAVPLLADIQAHLDDGHRGEILRDGFRVALLGPPNAGKSSLLNALAQRDVAIVSDEAGTTRDVIDVRLDLEGLPIIISDTAGMRETAGLVEREGMRRSLAAARDANLVLWLSETGDDLPPHEIADRPVLAIHTKADLFEPVRVSRESKVNGGLAISSTTGAGLDVLLSQLAERARSTIGVSSQIDAPVVTQARHRHSLELARVALSSFIERSPLELELRAEDVRRAVYALGRITGRVDVEDVLGQIFSRFCIGK